MTIAEQIAHIEPIPFVAVPEPGYLRLVPPPEPQIRPTPAPRPTEPAVAPVAPLRTRVLVHADPARARLHGAPLDPDDDVDPQFGKRLTGSGDLPDPVRWSGQFTQAALEVMAGRRSPMQLMRWANRTVFAHLTYRPGVINGRVGIRRIRVCEPVDGVIEASVVVWINDRAQAIALRFEGLDGRWLCTAMDAHLLPKR